MPAKVGPRAKDHQDNYVEHVDRHPPPIVQINEGVHKLKVTVVSTELDWICGPLRVVNSGCQWYSLGSILLHRIALIMDVTKLVNVCPGAQTRRFVKGT